MIYIVDMIRIITKKYHYERKKLTINSQMSKLSEHKKVVQNLITFSDRYMRETEDGHSINLNYSQSLKVYQNGLDGVKQKSN